MFVRLYDGSTGQRSGRWRTLGHLLVAKVVEAYRDGEGRPRQRTIVYLGSIRETMRINFSIDFWQNVTSTLDRMGNIITQDERAKIEKQIQARVPFA